MDKITVFKKIFFVCRKFLIVIFNKNLQMYRWCEVRDQFIDIELKKVFVHIEKVYIIILKNKSKETGLSIKLN